MMISPGSFYDDVKDKSAEEIKTEIRRLKRSITKLKDESLKVFSASEQEILPA